MLKQDVNLPLRQLPPNNQPPRIVRIGIILQVVVSERLLADLRALDAGPGWIGVGCVMWSYEGEFVVGELLAFDELVEDLGGEVVVNLECAESALETVFDEGVLGGFFVAGFLGFFFALGK